MAVAQRSTGYYLEAARALATRVAAEADRIAQEREIPPDIVDEIADKGLFRLLVPRSLGGAELNYPDFLHIVQVFAEADASTAWCVNQNNIYATNSARMPEQTSREIWSDGRAVVTNGPPDSSSEAVPVDGGFRLTGRWNFSSGVRHATWVAALTPVRRLDSDDSSGRQEVRTLLVPKKDVSLIDVWQVSGLRGTGSFSFEADDIFVPNVRTFSPSDTPREDGPLYVIPAVLLFAGGFATVAMAAARAGLDTAIDIAGSKASTRDQSTLRMKSTTQRRIGEAEAVWHSARAFLGESTSLVWESASKNHALTIEERIRLRLASTHAIHMAAEVIDIAYKMCGSSSIFASDPIQRRFQDLHVITQQAQGRLAGYDTAGQFFLGLEPDGIF